MNATITTSTHPVLATLQARLGSLFTVASPTPNYSGPGSSALQTITNMLFGDVLILGIIGVLIAAACIVLGHVSSNNRLMKGGIIGVLGCIVGVALAGSAAGLINFGASLHVA
ncbi:hypothetical protein GCM10027568_29740 [Humibacter soli]